MITVIERTLKLKGLKEKKDILAMADMHLTLCDDRENDYSKELAAERSQWFHNAYACTEKVKEYIKETKPDYVIACGDMIDFPSHANLEYFIDFLNNHCPPYMYVLGNHDWNYPRNYNNVYNWRGNVPKFAPILKNGDPCVQVLDAGEFLIVGIDTNTDRVFRDTVDRLKEIGKLGKPMILVMHVAIWTPGTADIIYNASPENLLLAVGCPEFERQRVGRCPSCLGDEVSDELLRMVNDPEFPVFAMFYGHNHFETMGDDFVAEDHYMEGRVQYGIHKSAPGGRETPTVFRLHLIPDEE